MKQFKHDEQPPEGDWVNYKKTAIVPLLKMDEPFECHSREGVLKGQAGDFLAQDGHGGYYPISAKFHEANYEQA